MIYSENIITCNHLNILSYLSTNAHYTMIMDDPELPRILSQYHHILLNINEIYTCPIKMNLFIFLYNKYIIKQWNKCDMHINRTHELIHQRCRPFWFYVVIIATSRRRRFKTWLFSDIAVLNYWDNWPI